MTDSLIRSLFRGAGLGAALSEVETARQYPQYGKEACVVVGVKDKELAILILAIRRGNMWEPV